MSKRFLFYQIQNNPTFTDGGMGAMGVMTYLGFRFQIMKVVEYRKKIRSAYRLTKMNDTRET